MQDRRSWWLVPVLGAVVCGGITALLIANWVAGRVEEAAVAALEAAGLDDGVDYVGVAGLNGIGRDGVNVVLEGPAADQAAAVEVVTARSEIDEVVYRVVDDGSAGRTTGADQADQVEITTANLDAVPLLVVGRIHSDPETTPEDRQRNRRIEGELSW